MTSTNAISPISTQNVSYTRKGEVQKLIKYVNNEALKDVPDTFSSTAKSAVGTAAVFEGLPLLKFLKNLKTGSEAKEGLNILAKVNKESLNTLLKGEGSFVSRLGDYIIKSNASKETYKSVKTIGKLEAKSAKLTKKAAKLAAKHADKAEKLTSKATKMAAEVTTKSGAVKEMGAKAAEATAKTAGKAGKLGKFLKSSGAGFMLVFSGLAECFTEVVPTFKELGNEKGMKQLGKSVIKVVGDTVGFIGGEAAGTAVGAAIGTAICPVVGTAIGGAMGAIVGFVGGMLGSFVAGKVTKAITGPSEREIANKKAQESQAEKLSKDNQSLEELKNEVMLKLQEDGQDGDLSEDSLIALEALQNLENSNPFEQAAAV